GELLRHLSKHLHILGYMVTADYHPLRIALAGASGRDSRAVRQWMDLVAGLAAPLEGALRDTGAWVGDGLQGPERYPAETSYLEALGEIEAACADYFFQQVRVAARMSGTESAGSGAPGGIPMDSRFTPALFPGLDAARLSLHELSNLGCAPELGS